MIFPLRSSPFRRNNAPANPQNAMRMVRLRAMNRNYLVGIASRSLTRAKLSAKEEWREILREPQTGPLE